MIKSTANQKTADSETGKQIAFEICLLVDESIECQIQKRNGRCGIKGGEHNNLCQRNRNKVPNLFET